MICTEENEEIGALLGDFGDLTFLPAPIQQKALRLKAELLVGNVEEELNMILYLVESHFPGLRLKVEMETDAQVWLGETEQPILNKDHLSFSTNQPLLFDKVEVDVMLSRVAEMPKEWTLVQITPGFSRDEIFGLNLDNVHTNGIHITVFNCGGMEKPYCVSVSREENLTCRSAIKKLKSNLKEVYSSANDQKKFIKQRYYKMRLEMGDTLEGILRDFEEFWLGAWKCLLIGKLVDESHELKIRDLLSKFLDERSLGKISQKVENILIQLVKWSGINRYTMDKYAAEILEYCFPGMNLTSAWKSYWKLHAILTEGAERHPVILMIDETLDAIPWEMISTLSEHPSSRMSSFHLLYAVFKAHEETIVDGYKIVSNFKNGRYVLNPSLDLALMETRMTTFFDYWLPDWSGLAGKAPTSNEFIGYLTGSDIFCYSGHGSGAQYCSAEKIQKKKISSVVFLLGCGSTELSEQGPEVEMFGTSQMYLIAACPCVVGMLWVVTDVDTDMLTANLLSYWIPNPEKVHWQLINQKGWAENGKAVQTEQENAGCVNKEIRNEPNLLRAMILAKGKMKYLCNKAAVVARGIPVKLGKI